MTGRRSNQTKRGKTLTASVSHTAFGARISLNSGEKLASGVHQHGRSDQASDAAGRSVEKRGHKRREARSMGCRPFVTATNQLLSETRPYYAQSTQDERRRKLRRIYKLLLDLEAEGRIITTSPRRLTEADVGEIIGWLKANLDATTASHYLKFLDEVLESVGNNVISRLKVKRRHLLPRPMTKSINVIPSGSMNILLSEGYSLRDPWWDATAKAAIAICSHSGLRSSELRLARMDDIDLDGLEIRVSSPKGKGRWASGTERTPIMPGCEDRIRRYLELRKDALARAGLSDHETLFPFISTKGKVSNWSMPMWSKLKKEIETASGQRFMWKSFRATYAQTLKDADAPIEAISRCLRHTTTKTTEQYYGRIRPESAFSQVRAAWQARKPLAQQNSILAD